MQTAVDVGKLIADLKAQSVPNGEIAWKAALACVGWAYVFGARGQYCDPVNRRSFFASQGADHPTIKSACKNFDGSDKEVGKCASCKWYPGGRTRFFDCRGFTYWILKQATGKELMGAGATSQWNTESNWRAKGEIDTMPQGTLCCLFVRKGNKMEHTGFGLNNETVECSSGVQHFTKRNKKWTHWAVPACIEGGVHPEPTKPTLRRGDKGEYVTLLQSQLKSRGYDLGSCGIDGDFGKATLAAVKQFQKDCGLTADGVVGKDTWAMLDNSILKTIHIPHLTQAKADSLKKEYPDAWITEDSNA